MIKAQPNIAASKPNIVFIVADQMRAHALGVMGNKQIITPNLDALAAQGIMTRNAISNQPSAPLFELN